jgi:NTE family protein
MKKYDVGLVLSGGAARGLAHLGVLKALEENGLKPGIISGVSAGAIAGAFYCDGFAPEEILNIYTGKNLFDLVQITIPHTGLFKLSGMKKVLNKYLRAKRFEDLKIPLVVTATSLNKGEAVYFREGDLADAILASSAVPVLFEAQVINKVEYIDGGITDNLPLTPIIHDAERAFHLAIAKDIENQKPLFDIFIEPIDIANYGFFDLKNGHDLFRIGYETAIKMIEESD